MNKKAVLIKKLSGFTGEAWLYELSPPIKDDNGKKQKYVCVSATYAMFTGPETYIFPCDNKGKVTNWGELDGSYRGGLDPEEALMGAGYSVEKED